MHSFLFFKSWDGSLISCLFISGRQFFIVAVAILLLHGFPLICVYSFCSIWIASIYVNTVSFILFGVYFVCLKYLLWFDQQYKLIKWPEQQYIGLLIWSYQQYQFIKYCQRIVKIIRDTTPATNIAFSSIVLRKETKHQW